jgi:hypothetical protein
MHDLGGGPDGERRLVMTAVLCGVEALSAQRWVVGAISFCADFPRGTTEWGRVPERIGEAGCVSRELKGEG